MYENEYSIEGSVMGEFYGNQHTDPDTFDYTYEELVEDVSRLADDLNRPPTTQDAAEADELPSVATLYKIIPEDWITVLRDAGVKPTKHQKRSAPTDFRDQILEDIGRSNRKTETDTLTLRQYDENGDFASSSVKERFGSWADACEAAGIDCGSRHGDQCTGPHGARLDSRHERLVSVFLDVRGIEYEVHPPVGDLGYESDFYLPEVELWVEVDGYVDGGRPNMANMEAKQEFFESNDLDFVLVQHSDELAAELRNRGVLSD